MMNDGGAYGPNRVGDLLHPSYGDRIGVNDGLRSQQGTAEGIRDLRRTRMAQDLHQQGGLQGQQQQQQKQQPHQWYLYRTASTTNESSSVASAGSPPSDQRGNAAPGAGGQNTDNAAAPGAGGQNTGQNGQHGYVSIRNLGLGPLPSSSMASSNALPEPSQSYNHEDADVEQSVLRMRRMAKELDEQRQKREQQELDFELTELAREMEAPAKHLASSSFGGSYVQGEFAGGFLSGQDRQREGMPSYDDGGVEEEPRRNESERGKRHRREKRRRRRRRRDSYADAEAHADAADSSGWWRSYGRRGSYDDDYYDDYDEEPFLLQMCPESGPFMASVFCGTLAVCWLI